MKIKCPHCQKILTVPDEYKRKQIKCGACHQVFVRKPIKEASELPISKQSSLPESNRTLWITAIVVATGLALVIGFACGALITQPNREEHKSALAAAEAKAKLAQNNAREKIQQANAEAIRQAAKLKEAKVEIERLRNELIRVTYQPKKAQDAVEPEKGITIDIEQRTGPKSVNKGGVLTKPMFGIYLGESINSLRKRTTVSSSTYYFEDEDHPGKIWYVRNPKPEVKELLVSTFDRKIYKIQVRFVDGSRTNYEAISRQLEHKYKSDDEGGVTGAMFGEAVFKPVIEGVPVTIELNHDMGFVGADKLELQYTHGPLSQQVYKEIQRRKALKIRDQL